VTEPFAERPHSVDPYLWTPIEIDDLEPGAWDALRHAGAAAVSAGPGAGKTEFLAQRAAYLLQTSTCNAPRRILAISFKRESAANLKRRVTRRVPEHADRFVSMTFDAFAKGILDRFYRLLPADWSLDKGEYLLEYATKQQVQNTIGELLRTEQTAEGRQALTAVQPSSFLTLVVGAWELPIAFSAPLPTDQAAYAAYRWWEDQYQRVRPPTLDFTMINRLADVIVRANPALRRALRATYPFVFVDEFQDTTDAQISFLRNVFGPPGVITTAVGDRKQRIMRFAGALEDAIVRFEDEFGAERFDLTWNFRSSPELVDVQHQIASVLDPTVAKAISRARVEHGHTALSIWNYQNELAHAEHLGSWIASEVRDSGRQPSDFALLARQKITTLVPALEAAFARYGLKLRNDEERFGKLTLQEVLKHELTHLVIGVLQLARIDRQLPDAWLDTLALIRRVREPYDLRGDRAAADHLAAFAADLRVWLDERPASAATAAEVFAAASSVVDAAELRAFILGQDIGDEFDAIKAAIILRLEQSMQATSNWDDVLRAFLAVDAVPIMTYHRSKGLEYHTVIALALDGEQWWSYKGDPEEGNSTFFVGLSRAAHRVIFTSYSPVARRRLPDLYALLDAAGAEQTDWV